MSKQTQTTQITEASDPAIWALLQPPAQSQPQPQSQSVESTDEQS